MGLLFSLRISTKPDGNRPQAGAMWLVTLRRYLLLATAGNLIWEIFQLPGFADWREGSWRWLAFIVVIGTAGDVLIAATSMVLGLVVVGDDGWPERDTSYRRVAIAASAVGVVYTAYSEWRHAVVLRHWTYSALMPVVPGLGVGIFPLLQWILIPAAAFYYARADFRHTDRSHADENRPLPSSKS